MDHYEVSYVDEEREIHPIYVNRVRASGKCLRDGCSKNVKEKTSAYHRLFCDDHYFTIFAELIKDVENAAIICLAYGCRNKAEVLRCFCHTHQTRMPEIDRPPMTDADILCEIKKSCERDDVKKALKSKTGFYAGYTCDISDRLNHHRRFSRCDDIVILFEACNEEEGSRAERIAINFFALHDDDEIRFGLRNGHGGGVHDRGDDAKRSRTFVYLLYDRFGVNHPGFINNEPAFLGGNLQISEIKLIINECKEKLKKIVGDNVFVCGISANFDERMYQYNKYEGFKKLNAANFSQAIVYRWKQNKRMNLTDFRLLEQGVICACFDDEKLKNQIINTTGGGEYASEESDGELVLYVRLAKNGLTPQDVRQMRREQEQKIKAKKNNDDEIDKPVEITVDEDKKNAHVNLIYSEDGYIDFRKSFPMENFAERFGWRLKLKEKIVKKFACVCGSVFARKNALQAHIRAKTSVEPLFKCDKLNEVTRQPCGYSTNYSSAFKRHIKRHEHKMKNLLLGRIGGTKGKGLGQYITDMNPKTQPGTSKAAAAAATTTTKKMIVTANKSMMKLITTKTTRISRSTAAKNNTEATIKVSSSSSSEDSVLLKVKKNIKPLIFSSSSSTSSSSEQSVIEKPKRKLRKLSSSDSN